MKIVIGADIAPTNSTRKAFETGCIEEITDAPLREVLSQADYRISNLECPLTDKEQPIAKCGSSLIAPAASIKGIKALGIDFCTLANNHIMDQGEQGLLSTTKVLREAGIAYAGVGHTLLQAQKA